MGSGSKKRSFFEFAAGSDPTLTVITTDGGRIPAHNEVRCSQLSLLASQQQHALPAASGLWRVLLQSAEHSMLAEMRIVVASAVVTDNQH
jgi:hypothetical protein